MIGRMMQVGTMSLAGEGADPSPRLASRGARARAFLYDAGALAGGALAASIAGVVYLLIRTGRGTYDASDLDSAFAAALLFAVPPTQAAWLVLSVIEYGATPGQRRAGLAIARREGGWGGARFLRMALHPLSLPAWAWLGAVLMLLGVPVPPWTMGLWGGLLILGGLGSAALFAFRPSAPGLHDRVSGTRVVVRP